MEKDLQSCHIFNKAFCSSISEHSAKSFQDEKPNGTLTVTNCVPFRQMRN